ncbi:putative cytosine-specific methyltransferase (truncated) [Spiroplasma eriocheiris CCTCC M 207170]|nr:putative cytosine-specific methyltransferase (truncated) [Spiroplasma eriocheiris CCTCC M 207170]
MGSIKNIKANDLNFDFDLLTYSFPCQDLSIANMGRAKGMKKGDNTRSGLLWEIQRILNELKELSINRLPKYLLLENVPNMLNDKHIVDYNEWINYLNDELGYKTFTMQLTFW